MNQNQNQGQIFTDRELMDDLLSSQKFIANNYNSFANECVSNQLRSDFMNILNDEHQIQYSLFTDMSRRGWYQPEPAEQQKINQTKQKFVQG